MTLRELFMLGEKLKTRAKSVVYHFHDINKINLNSVKNT